MTNPTPHQPSARDLTHKMYDLMNAFAYSRLGEVIADDAVIEWPQSAERLRGWVPVQRIMEAYPGGRIDWPVTDVAFPEGEDGRYLLTPMFTVVRTESMGDTATSTVKTRYPDGSDWFIISIARAYAGKIVHMTQYFAPLYEAPEWRAEWVERIDAGR